MSRAPTWVPTRGTTRVSTRRAGLGLAIALGCLALLNPASTEACGPDLPRSMLTQDQASLCRAPALRFATLVHAAIGEPLPARANGATAEAAGELDVRAALEAAEVDPATIDDLVADYLDARANLRALPDALPQEFIDYFDGVRAWRRGESGRARAIWASLLERPSDERHHRSVWAAYMLGQTDPSWTCASQDSRWERVRTLAAEGFADRQALAAASYGEQARCHLHRGRRVPALHLYATQARTGDEGAIASLRFVLAEVFVEGQAPARAELRELADDPLARALASAYLTANPMSAERGGWTGAWLATLEARVPVGERIALAGPLAWSAYQSGDADAAARWVALAASDDLLARWTGAKLELRAGDLDAARRELARLEAEMAGVEIGLAAWDGRYGEWGHDGALARSTAAELGALQTVAGEHASALMAFVRADSIIDAAYVAENLLSVDELEALVRVAMPPPPPIPSTGQLDAAPYEPSSVSAVDARIRWLLARRLARAGQWTRARPYFPPAEQRLVDAQLADLQTVAHARDPETRARALWQIAVRTRYQGMELLGTELAPDWTVYSGTFDPESTFALREQTDGVNNPDPSSGRDPDERQLRAAHRDFRPVRFQYRRTAAQIAEQAAAALPEGHPGAGPILCTASGWIDSRDASGPPERWRLAQAGRQRSRTLELRWVGSGADWIPDSDDCRAELRNVRIPGLRGSTPADDGPRPFYRAERAHLGWPWVAVVGLGCFVVLLTLPRPE